MVAPKQKEGFFQRAVGKVGKLADRVDNALFKTEAAGKARQNLDNPEFARFLAQTAEAEQIDPSELQAGGNERKLGASYERFERMNATIARAKDVLTTQFKEKMGVDITDAELASVDTYFKDAPFEDPKAFERLASTFEKGVKMQAEVAERRGRLEGLKDKFGRDKLELMNMREGGGILGNKETRAWAREEARNRGYGPVRSWMFKTFSANSAIQEKINEGSKISPEKRREAYEAIMDAEHGIGKIEGKMNNKLVARMLEQSDFATRAIEIARAKVVTEVASAITNPGSQSIQELVEKREKMKKFVESSFAPEDGLVTADGLISGNVEYDVETLMGGLEMAVEHQVDLKMGELVDAVASFDVPFARLLKFVQEVAQDLSDGTPDGDRAARIQVAERLAQRPTENLTTRKSMMVSMVINHLTR